MKISSLYLLLLLSVLSVTLYCQEEESQKELDEVKLLSQLTQEHYFLHQMEGSWKLSGVNYSNNGEIPIKGKAQISKILNGHYIEILFAVEHMAGFSETKMIIGYDTRYAQYTQYTIDDMLNYATTSTGTREDNKLIFTGRNKFIFFKEEIDFKIEIEREKENKIVYSLFFKTDGKYMKMLKYQLIKQ